MRGGVVGVGVEDEHAAGAGVAHPHRDGPGLGLVAAGEVAGELAGHGGQAARFVAARAGLRSQTVTALFEGRFVQPRVTSRAARKDR